LGINSIRNHYRNKKKIDKNLEGHKRYLDSIEAASTDVTKPNIVIFFMDDLGFGDISCYGAQNISTPSIDSLAKNGVKFTSFYFLLQFVHPRGLHY